MSIALGCVAENTPKYLGQAVRLVQSVRWFGGVLNEAKLYVCVVDDIRQDFREELERYGATIHIVPRFSTKHPQSNKLRFLELPDIARHDRVLLLDCDTIVVRDPSSDLFRADFTAKIADIPTVPLDTFRRIFAAFGLSMPRADQLCTVRGASTIPYFNAGVLAFSRRGMDILVPKWIELNEQLIASMELLEGHENFCEQASLSLALAATGINFDVVGNAFNFPMHFDDPATAQGLADTEPFIIHYHWLVDPSGYILPSAYSAVNSRIDEFNARLRQERESRFDNRLFWNQRYAENPELGSGVGSRGEARDYKRHLLKEAAARWTPRTILDVGCGDLDVGSVLPADGYTGLDFSEVVIATNRGKFPDRVFLAGNFIEMERARADMVVCLDVLIHLASLDEYRNFVRKLVRSTSKVGIVAGDETEPGLGSIVFYHEPLSRTLAEAGATNIRKIGTYRHVTVFEYTPPSPESRTALIVLGMHRSGTSALTGCLRLLGVELGSNLIPAHSEHNAKGHWEHREVVTLNERLLASMERTWHDERLLPNGWSKTPVAEAIVGEIKTLLQREFAHTPLWGLKDPRLCRLLPLWLEAIAENGAEPFFVLALRHPVEVARSLARRDGISQERAYLLWLEYMLEAEQSSRGYSRIVVSYEALLADWRITLSPLFLRLGPKLSLGEPEISAQIDAFLSPALRHFTTESVMVPSTPWHSLAEETYRAFIDYAVEQPSAIFDGFYSRLEEMSKLVNPWTAQIQELIAIKNAQERELARISDRDILAAEVIRMKSTLSWQLTKPLRFVRNVLSRILPGRSVKS